MKRVALPVGLLLLTGATFFAAGVKLSFIKIEKQNSDIVLTWQVSVEEGVLRYEVLRRTQFSNGLFLKVAEVAPHGVGKLYQFRDDQVYKTTSEQVEYRIEAVYTDGAGEIRESFPLQSIDYTPTAVRRTWGSIKAMFQ